jgi:next-to-BRCA1 protein 1
MHTEPVVPNQATVEDELPSLAEHVSTPVVAEQPHEYHQAPKSSSPAVVSSQESVPNETSAPSVSEMQRGFEHLLTSRTSYGYPSTVTLPFLPARPVVSNDSEVSVTQGANARDRWLAELAGVHFDRQTAIRNGDGPPAVQSTYSVYCNKCNHPIPDEHYHCSTCDDGDFDLCQDCVNKGVLCNGEDHWMIKRFVKNGKVIVSTTETIAPRPTYAESKVTLVPAEESNVVEATRTCNSCIQGKPSNLGPNPLSTLC